jgi:hypothetical protein
MSAIPIPSGAYPLTTRDTDYIMNTYRQLIDMLGQPITYEIAQIIGEDQYEHPIITYTNKTINGFVSNITQDEYQYVETGFLPAHYANLWVYDADPQIGDHVVWMDIEWEVRGSYPMVIGTITVYYQCLIRRVLSSGTLQSGGTGGSVLPQDP